MELTKKSSYTSWQKCWLIFRHHRISAIGSFLLTIIVAIIMATGVERSYAANGKIQFPAHNKTSYFEGISVLNTITQRQDPLVEGITFLSSNSVVNQIVQQLELKDAEGNFLNYNEFIQKLNITKDLNHNSLDITYTCNDLEESKLVVNTLLKLYVNYQVDTRKKNQIKKQNFLQEQLNFAKIQLQDTKSELNIFLKQHNQNNLSINLIAFAKLNEIERKIKFAQNQVQQIDQNIIDLKVNLGITKSSQSKSQYSRLSEPKDQSLLAKEPTKPLDLARDKSNPNNYTDINLQLTPDHSDSVVNESKRQNNLSFVNMIDPQNLSEQLEKLINYEKDKSLWLSKIATWEKLKTNYQDNSPNVSAVIKAQYQDLLTKAEVAEKNYHTLAKQLQQAQIVSQSQDSDPVEISPVVIQNNLASWNKEIIIASGIGLGFIFALATALTMDKTNSSLKTPESIAELLNTKLLGKVPHLKQFNFGRLNNSQNILPERSVLEAPYAMASKAHKLIYRNLQVYNSQKNLKLITVASSVSEEGKSTFAANLAALTSQLGKKVLLIDANFYQPRQHEIWRISNHLGLTDLLKNHTKLENIIQSPSLNLDIITTGFVFGDGLALLQSETMKQLVNLVRKKYDLTIFDTPSINLSPNALTINKFTDGLILVGKTGVSNYRAIMRTKELLEKSQQVVLGLVVNDKMSKFTG